MLICYFFCLAAVVTRARTGAFDLTTKQYPRRVTPGSDGKPQTRTSYQNNSPVLYHRGGYKYSVYLELSPFVSEDKVAGTGESTVGPSGMTLVIGPIESRGRKTPIEHGPLQ